MEPARWNRIKELFAEALELEGPERDRFVSAIEAELRGEVESLLANYYAARDFIETPAVAVPGIGGPAESMVGQRIDDYRLIGLVGSGGMGTVYLAEHGADGLSHRVALKLIKRGMDTGVVLKRFFRERQILANLDHPNIARFLDGGSTEDGLPYFVMEHVEGLPINQYCEENSITTRERLELFRKVCSAVSFAHRNLVVHRDLKPSNIIVTKAGEPKLLDFGIAKLLQPGWTDGTDEATMTMFRALTPEYASPEQLQGKNVTTASDVYSLGVILFELLTGRRPFAFKSVSAEEAARQIIEFEPPRPSSVTNRSRTARNEGADRTAGGDQKFGTPQLKIPVGDLDNIIVKALCPAEANRYGSVQQFSEDIARFLDGLPVTARSNTFGYRLGKYIKRNKIAAAAAALVLCSLVGGVSLATWQSMVAQRERDRANARFEKLRETARSLMTEIRDDLDDVPGTIGLRESLSEKSVDLLDSFYEDNSSDPDFLKDLADAYEKLGKTQLWEFRLLKGAQKNIERAVAIRRRTFALDPALGRKKELAETLSSLTEAQYFSRDASGFEPARTEREGILRGIVAEESTSENLSALAQHLAGFVGTYKEFHLIGENGVKLDEAAAIFRHIADSEQGSRDLTPSRKAFVAWNLICLGGVLKHLGDDAEALTRFESAITLAEQAYDVDETLQSAFNLNGLAHREAGELHERKGEYARALDLYRRSLDWLKRREGNESQSKPYLAWASANSASRCALMLQRLKREKEASEIVEQPWREYSDFLGFETNASSIVYSVEPIQRLTSYLTEAGRVNEAVEIWSAHAKRLKKFLDRNPEDVDFALRLIHAEATVGDIHAGFNRNDGILRAGESRRRSQAKIRYMTALELLSGLPDANIPPSRTHELTESIKIRIRQLGD